MNHMLIAWFITSSGVMKNSKNFSHVELESRTSFFLTDNAEQWFFTHWTKKLGLLS